MYGFPINFPYTDTKIIIDRLKAYGIHNTFQYHNRQTSNINVDKQVKNQFNLSKTSDLFVNSSANIQFALSVYIKAYPGPVLSIWVFLAALRRRSN